MNDAIRMQLSAFVDGELPENEAELLLRRMSQDAELRQHVAEYLAIGRLMRSESGLAGADRLHARIAAAIDDRSAAEGETTGVVSASRAIRPLAGIAIAASVALLAIFALQQSSDVDESPADVPAAIANAVVPSIDVQSERQRQYFRNHSESTTQFGANDLITSFVTMRYSEGVLEEPEEDAGDTTDDASEEPTQP